MNSSIQKYKSNFVITFARFMQEHLSEWEDAQRIARKDLYSWVSLKYYIGFSLLAFIPDIRELSDYNLKLHGCFAVVFLILAVFSVIYLNNKDYQKSIKKTLFPKLLEVFGSDIKYTDTQCIPTSVFENCQLFDFDIMTRKDDDNIYGVYNGVKFSMSETEFNLGQYDNNRTYHNMFDGLAMYFELNKTIKSSILINSRRFIKRKLGHFEKVTLEYDRFNKKYDVYTDGTYENSQGQIEARYLLNTVFMEGLMQIQTSFKVKEMSCSIYGNEMLILLHTNKDLFEMNHLLRRVDDVRQYNPLFEEFASVLSFIDILNLSSKTHL